uniref:BED-type domain-containing protein n=1 Tax=Meloidogyne enterolobii TaxID=390850 RepID=A0A6V7U3M9_MELEN|nr:unnamed protein product [Meloidogyne enterolobii]
MSNNDSWWFYFERLENSLVRCKAEDCKWVRDQGVTKSTTTLKHHLSTKHPDLYKIYQEAKLKKDAKIKKAAESQPKLSFKRATKEIEDIPSTSAKRPQSVLDEQPKITQAFTEWTQKGEKCQI